MTSLPYADPEFGENCRALYLKAGRLAEAVPARVSRSGRWEVDNAHGWKLMVHRHCLPDAIQEPSGQVREVGTGLVFPTRYEFLVARGAAPIGRTAA